MLVAIHVGAAAKISCRRVGESHTGSAVHGDIVANTNSPRIFAFGETPDGLALQLRSDPAGVLDTPAIRSK